MKYLCFFHQINDITVIPWQSFICVMTRIRDISVLTVNTFASVCLQYELFITTVSIEQVTENAYCCCLVLLASFLLSPSTGGCKFISSLLLVLRIKFANSYKFSGSICVGALEKKLVKYSRNVTNCKSNRKKKTYTHKSEMSVRINCKFRKPWT